MKKILFVFAAILLLANGVSAQNGYSTYTWPDGNNKFEGYFVNGVMHGSGIHYWSDNHYVVGQWVNGAIDGYCIEIQNGAHKLVYYENGKAATRNVRSNQTLNTGVGIYTGEMSNGRACGRGTFRWNSGLCFEGTWTADGKSRYGVLYYPNTRKPWHIGTWTNEQFDGYGCIVSESGQLTVGLWQNGEYLCKSRLNNAGENSQIDDLRLEIELLIEETNKLYPRSVRRGITTMGQYVDGDYVIITNNIDENVFSLRQFEYVKNDIKRSIIDSYNTDQRLVDLTKKLIKCGIGLHVKYVGEQSKKEVNIIITPKDLSIM